MQKECTHCKNKFEAKRMSAKFCSNVCRTLYNRSNSESRLSLSQKIDFIYDYIVSSLSGEMSPKVSEKPKNNIPEKLPNESTIEYKIRISELKNN